MIGEHEGDKRQQGERGRQHYLVDRPVCPPMLGRHQLGGDRKRRRDVKPNPMPVIRRRISSCSKFCDTKISRVHNVLRITPICITVKRLTRSDIAAAAKPPRTTTKVGPTASQRTSSGVRCSGALASTRSEPESAIVALNKADEPEYHNQRNVVDAERDAVELAPEHMACGSRRNSYDTGRCHDVLLPRRLTDHAVCRQREASPDHYPERT